MTFDEYQTQALTTAIDHPHDQLDKTIWALGIVGEAGEVAEKWKKIVAYREGVVTDEDRIEIQKELGDVLWYIAVFAHKLGISFDDVARMNAEKLASRQKRNIIKGAGDNR